MTPQRRAALNLADALLAVRAELDAMVAAAVHIFGRKWRWIPGLCKHLLNATGENLHDYERAELASLIEGREAFARAWRDPGKCPRIAAYALEAPLPKARPVWLPRDVPLLRSPSSLARWLGLSAAELAWFGGSWRLDEKDAPRLDHYAYRWVSKRSGGFRLIEMPKSRLREIQRRVLHGLLEKIPAHQAAHGFVAGRSCVSHAALHHGKAAVIRLDLRDFFSSVPASRVHALLTSLAYSPAVAGLLTGIATHATPWRELNRRENRARIPYVQRQRLSAPHLPQGAPTSPALANLCAFRLDLRLDALAKSMNAVYSRYADDLVFSGGRELLAGAQRFVALVGAIALEEGFALNRHKTRVMSASQRQQVTGLVVNRFPNVPRKDFDQLKAVLHNCLRHGAASQNREGVRDFRAHLMGKIAYVASLHPVRGKRLRELFEQIDWCG